MSGAKREKQIADYAMIGDCQTAAMVGLDGSIDWLCWPRFDSEACMAALLGTEENGFWRVAPVGEITAVRRRYLEDTLVLETVFETADGEVAVTDFLPVRDQRANLIRLVEGRRGAVEVASVLKLRFDYGRLTPWVAAKADGEAVAIAGPHGVVLRSSVPIEVGEAALECATVLKQGDELRLCLSFFPSHEEPTQDIDPRTALNDTVNFWREWISRCSYDGPYGEAVHRSLITLKGLTYEPTGGTVAAATASLPEHPGGERNWDYRFCWLRDATFMLLAFLDAGFREEAVAWRDWLVRAIAGEPDQVQPLYGIAGEHRLPEWTAPWLAGFGGAQPVRFGNEAKDQLQLDVFGEVLDAMHQARLHGIPADAASWNLQRALVEHLCGIWREPDAGIWEIRGPLQHFTHSKIMVWVALDRAIRRAEEDDLPCEVDRWRRIRDEIHHEVCTRGYDPEREAFVQAFGSKALDASLLLIAEVGFLPPDDPRLVATVRAIERELMPDGLVLRYSTDEVNDGLSGKEGAFLACSFWLVDNLVMQGRADEAQALFERLVALCNDVGLMAEQVDVATGGFLGNTPQALSHLSLVNSALNLSQARGPAEERRARR